METKEKELRKYTLVEPTFNNLILEQDARWEYNEATDLIRDSIKFWKREGPFVYASNLSKGYGSVESRKRCLEKTYDDWLLDMIESDCKIAIMGHLRDQNREWSCYRTSSHVAVHNEHNDRICLIKFNFEVYETQ